jgi:uncharacterized membrane protein
MIINAHPPTSVLLTLPLGRLEFPHAFVVWDAFSLVLLVSSVWMIARGVQIPVSVYGVLALVALLFVWQPTIQQFAQGQLNCALLFLITAGWTADRSGRPILAGSSLGAAAAIKLFPAFLLLYFLLLRKWRALTSGVLAAFALTAVTALILGPDTYLDYFHNALPRTEIYRGAAHNISLTGIWYKLFDPIPHWAPIEMVPLVRNPALAGACTVITTGMVLLIIWRAAKRADVDADFVFGAVLIGMLVISPVTWDHYCLLMVPALGIAWTRLPRSGAARWVFYSACLILSVGPVTVMQGCLFLTAADRVRESGKWLCPPLETVTALSVPTYALVCLFGLFVWMAPRPRVRDAGLDRQASPFSA